MITVLFSCPRCGLTDCEASVRAREETEDVRGWMRDSVGSSMFFAHTVESPNCLSRVFSDVKIPMPKHDDPTPWIGKQTDNVPPKGKSSCPE